MALSQRRCTSKPPVKGPIRLISTPYCASTPPAKPSTTATAAFYNTFYATWRAAPSDSPSHGQAGSCAVLTELRWQPFRAGQDRSRKLGKAGHAYGRLSVGIPEAEALVDGKLRSGMTHRQ